MAYDEHLADRVRQTMRDSSVAFSEKKMMGGLIFMVDEKMCIGVDKDKNRNEDRLMVRIGPEEYEASLKAKGSRKMDFTGTPMKGFVFISPEGFDQDNDLSYWVGKALAYNKIAPRSKK